jgi:hypothetical protein
MSGVWLGLWLLLGALLIELFRPKLIEEGFKAFRSSQPVTEKQNVITNMILRRGDVGINQDDWIQDRRYFAGYADVQRYGVKNDFCRMVVPLNGKDDEAFFACALAGTVGSSVAFKTPAVKDGFAIGRDDYMRDILKEGRDAYCRILKGPSGFLPQCRRATDTGFSAKDELDANPPSDIQTMLQFYESCELWLRLQDDMLDYIGKATLQVAGGVSINEAPSNQVRRADTPADPILTKGIHLNGQDQFVRIGDSQTLELGAQIKLRTIRAFSIWARFDEFTNNAHLFDFGDGPGKNNVFLGILGRGDAEFNPRTGGACETSTVPAAPSGAQFCPELKAQDLLEESAGNVDEYVCTGPEITPRRLEPIETKPLPTTKANRATLLYEVWDKTLRKVQIKVNRAIPLGKWVHIAITATSMDAMRPQLKVYVDGEDLYTLDDGALPQAATLSNNYLGKSNWASGFSLYEMQDELFKGSLFDFRMYSAPLTAKKVQAIRAWGLDRLVN